MAKKIMVINDTADVLELFEDILTDAGYEVVLYSMQIRNLEPVEAIMPDLVVVDQLFGDEKSGWQLIQMMRMSSTTENIPIVVCSAALRQLQELEGHLKNMQIEVVVKPFRILDLVNAVKRALDQNSQTLAKTISSKKP